MKKVIITFVCLSIFFAGKSQFAVNGGDTMRVNGTTSPSSAIIGTGQCSNNGVDTITLTWELVSDSTVPGWTYTGFCDKNNCYDFVLNQEHSFTMAPNTRGILELHLTQGCVTGVGNVKFLLWNRADSAGTVQLVTVIVTVTEGTGCPSGIAETEAAQFVLYPDPVRDQLKVALPQSSGNGRIEIFNVLGSKICSQIVNENENVKYLDLSGLDAGMYVATITENGKLIAAKKFIKQD